MSQYIKLFWEL